MDVLFEVNYELKLNQDVQTPLGPGVIQGYTNDAGPVQIIVAHDPNLPSLPDAWKRLYPGDIWVLGYYPPEQVTPLKK